VIEATLIHEAFWGGLAAVVAVVFVCWLSTTDWWDYTR
jgi:hypothetical protein